MNAPDRESAKDRLLDLFVFAPVGIALTLVEELPSLVEKGRNRIEGQSATARVIGQFAVQFGSREVTRRVRQVLEPESATRAKPARAPAPSMPEQKTDTSDRHEPSRRHDEVHAASHLESQATSTRRDNGQVARGDLAIPAYDTLSASQVVKLLAGLSREELIEVRTHELSNRHRATILNRVEQLLSGEPSLETP
jgi:hypothetical protein